MTAGLYELVREPLFAAAEVLGEVVTTEVAVAWHEVSTLMTNSLIEQETRLYERAGVPPGQVRRPVVVAAREYDGAHAATLFLWPVDDRPLPVYRPGRHISVRVPLLDGAEQIRRYTVARGRRGEWALSVERMPGGCVSPVLVDQVTAERLASLRQRCDDDGDMPLLLVSAGIGGYQHLGGPAAPRGAEFRLAGDRRAREKFGIRAGAGVSSSASWRRCCPGRGRTCATPSSIPSTTTTAALR